jgi:hypothetical protein
VADVTREQLERWIMTMAYIVTRHGPRYAPLLERLEREYRERFHDPVAHAQALLDHYNRTRQRSAGRLSGKR